nr:MULTISPECIES: LuxR family transcriptional regulator [Pseudomonas]
MNLLIQQMVSNISERDGRVAIENALQWLRQECRCERALFYQFKSASLLTLVTSNVDDAWSRFYRQGQMLTEDPVIRCYRNRMGFIDWRDAFRQYPASTACQDMAQRCALLPAQSYGYTSHCRGMNGVVSVCTLAGLNRNPGSEDKYLLSSLVPVLHMVGHGAQLRAHGLTDRELEILRWAREGKTRWEIAAMREVGEATIKYHFKAIYRKLGVANRAQAVGEALCRGLIG